VVVAEEEEFGARGRAVATTEEAGVHACRAATAAEEVGSSGVNGGGGDRGVESARRELREF
jgi:hypothetical protein